MRPSRGPAESESGCMARTWPLPAQACRSSGRAMPTHGLPQALRLLHLRGSAGSLRTLGVTSGEHRPNLITTRRLAVLKSRRSAAWSRQWCRTISGAYALPFRTRRALSNVPGRAVRSVEWESAICAHRPARSENSGPRPKPPALLCMRPFCSSPTTGVQARRRP